MTATEIIMVSLLLVIAAQTTYGTYRSWRGNMQAKNESIFVDTSVLMDGRIVQIAKTGFAPGQLVIPRSVIGELQFLADNADPEKRSRARKGLDVVNELQAMENVDVELLQDGSKADEGVDERLLKLAKKHGGKICTIDFNLNKVAQVEDIEVLNVNELAKNLRMSYLPGDIVSLTLTTAGSDTHQAVGHLDDGTMVVVEQARQMIGQTVDIEIIRSLQTDAGRMMFAKLVKPKNGQKKADKSVRKKQLPNNGQGRKPSNQPSKPVANNQRRSSKRRTNEDRLIELVDSQEADK